MLRIVARRSLALTVQKRMDPIQAIFVNKVILIFTNILIIEEFNQFL